MVWDPAAETKISGFLDTLRAAGLRLDYTLHRAPEHEAPATHAHSHEDAALSLAAPTAAAGIAPQPALRVDLAGPDAPLLIERHGELLHALESLAAAILRLEPEEHEALSFDALGFKEARQAATEKTAQQGIDAVHATGKPFVFPPMNSRERRMLHLVLATSGLPTASSGEGPRRFVVVYPLGMTPTPERFNPPAPPPRRTGFSGGRGGSGFGRRPGPGRGPRPPFPPPRPAAPPPPRLDPNGNPLEPELPQEREAVTSEEERLASLRRAFRKR